MASEQLPQLLRTVRQVEPYGAMGYGPMTANHQEHVFKQLEGVEADFKEEMGQHLERGFPGFGPEKRNAMLGGISLLSVAYSAGLSNGELKKSPLVTMADITAITGVANRLIDLGDPLMRDATLRWCGIHPNPESAMSNEEASRLAFLQGINKSIRTTIHRKDRGTTLSVMHNLMAANVGAHDLTMQWKNAGEEHEAAFWDEHTNEVAHNLLVTGAIQSATIPLLGMYRRHPNTPTVREVWSNQFVQKQCTAANAIIRVDDDYGDRQRDANPKTMSINLFNLASSPYGERLISAFCMQSGINDTPTIDRLITAFRAVSLDNGAEEAMGVIRYEFEQNFRTTNESVPKAFDRHTTLVIRALAAGRANAIGDDAL